VGWGHGLDWLVGDRERLPELVNAIINNKCGELRNYYLLRKNSLPLN
jgi:hypothetical protein